MSSAISEPGSSPGARPGRDLRDAYALKLSEMGRLWRSYHERVLKGLGVSLVQWHALHYLAQQRDPVVQRRLATAVGVEEPVLVGVLDRLEAAGLVRRKAAKHDRRAKTVHLTPAAHEVLDAAELALQDARRFLLADFSGPQLEQGIAMFERLTERLWDLSARGARGRDGAGR